MHDSMHIGSCGIAIASRYQTGSKSQNKWAEWQPPIGLEVVSVTGYGNQTQIHLDNRCLDNCVPSCHASRARRHNYRKAVACRAEQSLEATGV